MGVWVTELGRVYNHGNMVRGLAGEMARWAREGDKAR